MKQTWALAVIALMCWPTLATDCTYPANCEVIYIDQQPQMYPFTIEPLRKSIGGEIHNIPRQEYFLLVGPAQVYMCFESSYQPSGIPSYSDGNILGTTAGIFISDLCSRYDPIKVLVYRRERGYYTHSSDFNNGFWDGISSSSSPSLFSQQSQQGYATVAILSPSEDRTAGFRNRYYSPSEYAKQLNQLQSENARLKKELESRNAVYTYSGGGYSGGSVHVRGYTRKDGTHVRSHYRSRPSK